MKNLAKIANFLNQNNIAHSSVVSCVWGEPEEIMELVVTHLDKTAVFTNAFGDRVHLTLNGTDKVTIRVAEAIDYIKSVFDLDKPAPTPDDYQLLVKRIDALQKRLDDMDKRAPTLDDYRLLEKRLDAIEKSLDHMGKRITDTALLAMCTGGSK